MIGIFLAVLVFSSLTVGNLAWQVNNKRVGFLAKVASVHQSTSPEKQLFQTKPTIQTSKALQSLRKSNTDEADSSNGLYLAAGIAGVASNVVCGYSLYVLKTTSCGLPPGPFGILGAAEGISYLVVVGTILWSLVTKVKTGKGLPAGPSGLLGASEGLSYLTLLAGVVIAGLNLHDYGFLPGFLPNDKCFGN